LASGRKKHKIIRL